MPGTLIRLRRRAKRLTQSELGARVGVGLRQVIRYEKGDSLPSEPVAVALAKTIGGQPSDYRPDQADEQPTSQHERELERVRVQNRDLRRRLEEIEQLVAQLVIRPPET